MTTFNKGDKVRYKSVPGFEKWAGMEGVIMAHTPGGNSEIRVTKDAPQTSYVGRVLPLHGANLELVTASAALAAGDKVRINGNALSHDWIGVEGTVTNLNYVGESVRLRITANPPYGYSVGDSITMPQHKLDVVAPEVPRTVEALEIEVGDRIRVTYSEESATYGDVTESASGVVREGTVHSITGGNKFDTKLGYRINPYRNGSEISYELLERPAPKPVRTTANAAVGTQFKTSHGPVGKRLLTKIAEDKWSDLFLETGNFFASDDQAAQEAFDVRGGEWIEV